MLGYTYYGANYWVYNTAFQFFGRQIGIYFIYIHIDDAIIRLKPRYRCIPRDIAILQYPY